MTRQVESLARISNERVLAELTRLLLGLHTRSETQAYRIITAALGAGLITPEEIDE